MKKNSEKLKLNVDFPFNEKSIFNKLYVYILYSHTIHTQVTHMHTGVYR